VRGFTPSQQYTVDTAREALISSHKLDRDAATHGDLCRNTMCLETTVEDLLRVIRELQDSA